MGSKSADKMSSIPKKKRLAPKPKKRFVLNSKNVRKLDEDQVRKVVKETDPGLALMKSEFIAFKQTLMLTWHGLYPA